MMLVIPFALAANDNGKIISGGKLIVTDMDVKVGSKTDKNLDYGDSIKDEAVPGDKVEFSIEVKNNFTSTEDLEIEDIQITITIEGIDDGDDLEEESKDFDLKDGKDEKKRISFEIPLEVEEDTFTVTIQIEGEGENGTDHEVEYELELEVQKEDNEVQFLRNSLTPSEIKCSRTVQLSTSVINTGADDEDEVTLEVTNAELGVSFREMFDLTNDAFDDDSKFRKTFTFTVDGDVASGIYPITSKVFFDENTDSKIATTELVVGECETLKKEEPKVEDKKDEDVVVVTKPTTPVVTQPGTAQPVTTPTLKSTEETSLFKSSGFLIALLVGEILLVIVAVVVVVSVLKRKKE